MNGCCNTDLIPPTSLSCIGGGRVVGVLEYGRNKLISVEVVWGGATSFAKVCLCCGKLIEILMASCNTDFSMDGPRVIYELMGCSGRVAAAVSVKQLGYERKQWNCHENVMLTGFCECNVEGGLLAAKHFAY